MINLLAEATEATTVNWGAVILQALATAGLVFGGAGFWEFVKTRFIAKREDKKEESGIERKVDNLTKEFSIISTKIDDVSIDLRDIKKDVILLQKANIETVKYREIRDKQDKDAIEAQKAVIISLKGMLRERLLDNYKRCMEKGYYSKEERETYGEMFKCYESDPFDGNGIMHQLQPIMQALPWTKEGARPKSSDIDN